MPRNSDPAPPPTSPPGFTYVGVHLPDGLLQWARTYGYARDQTLGVTITEALASLSARRTLEPHDAVAPARELPVIPADASRTRFGEMVAELDGSFFDSRELVTRRAVDDQLVHDLTEMRAR